MDLPIRRFITTNYDKELEKALRSRLGADYDQGKSFAQDDAEKLAIFTVALARNNRNMVFHCHGVLPEDSQQVPASEQSNTARSTLVLTDEDYKYWYPSDDRVVFTFQRCLEVLLQSNPLFFVGYSLNDTDLVRILRHLSITQVPRRVASNAFALIRRDSDKSALWCRAQQIKFGINLIPYESKTSLAEELKRQRSHYEEIRAAWRRQPRAKRRSKELITAIQPRPGKDLLFQNLGTDEFLKKINKAMGERKVAALLGPVGSGKYVKVCQFVRSEYAPEAEFKKLVFSSHGNEDIYAYLKRIVEIVRHCVVPKTAQAPEATLVDRLKNLLDSRPIESPKKLLLVISGIDLFLDFEESYDVVPEDASKGRLAEIKAELKQDRGRKQQASGPGQSEVTEGNDSPMDDRRGAGKSWMPRNTLADELGGMGNHRAQSYFMRHWASLLIRLGKFEEAEQTVRSSMAIAASENCADMVAFCRELLAKIYSRRDKPRDAIREYHVTLTRARKLGIARLQADALLGLAKVQLGLGDATAARVHAIEALKLANENLLVLRQIKALVIIGQAAAQLGAFEVGVSCLRHAATLASDSEFRLAEHDAEEARAELSVGWEIRGRSSFKQ